jgi:hypothetical protein
MGGVLEGLTGSDDSIVIYIYIYKYNGSDFCQPVPEGHPSKEQLRPSMMPLRVGHSAAVREYQ